jgi:SAM-dependent MidA family methyltransferase
LRELLDFIRGEIETGGPITAARFIDLALYHPELGYYARAGRRSGRGGDFFTSVDVGPLFGEMLAVQIAECLDLLGVPSTLVEAGAGNARLARDVFNALSRERPDLYSKTQLHLSERSGGARDEQRDVLGPHAARLTGSDDELPRGVTGVIYANELFDALPVHVVVMRRDGLREIFVTEKDGVLAEIEEPPSTPELHAYLERVGVRLQPGGRAEINLAADRWIAGASRALERGFLILIDYGHEADELYSGSHATGTLTTFAAHRAEDRAGAWLLDPGERDITAHVDLTSVRLAAERAGMTTLGITDQTYFLLGLGIADRLDPRSSRTGQAKTLLLPGGLGSTHKVMVFGKAIGRPSLKGLSYRVRVT